jgi:hypothetical protein
MRGKTQLNSNRKNRYRKPLLTILGCNQGS